jgi:hypothetical protein
VSRMKRTAILVVAATLGLLPGMRDSRTARSMRFCLLILFLVTWGTGACGSPLPPIVAPAAPSPAPPTGAPTAAPMPTSTAAHSVPGAANLDSGRLNRRGKAIRWQMPVLELSIGFRWPEDKASCV